MSNCLTGSSARRTDRLVWEWKYVSPEIAAVTESTVLSQLKEENKLGHGDSPEMYTIKADQSGRFVVVKKILNENDVKGKPKEIAEIEILQKIKHQNIVSMIGYFWSSTSTLILYPYFEKGSLHGLLHRNQALPSRGPNGSVHHEVLKWPDRIHIACGLAQGLYYMHHRSPTVFHGNLESSSILLDDRFNPKIAGFSSAKFGRASASTSITQMQDDVYKFGVILLELLIGKEESHKKEQPLVEWAHSYNDAPGNKQIAIDVLDKAIREPTYLKDINIVFKRVICCTDKSPSKRPDMEKVLMSLRRCKID